MGRYEQPQYKNPGELKADLRVVLDEREAAISLFASLESVQAQERAEWDETAKALVAMNDRYADALRDILDLKAGWTAIPSSDAARLLDQADSFARKALEAAR